MGKVIGWTIVIAMWTGVGISIKHYGENNPRNNKIVNTSEIVNTVEDMIEWISYDVENGKTDSIIADTYIDNLEQIIKEIK